MNQKLNRMVRVYSARQGLDAHLVKSALQQLDIRAEVRNETLSGLTGALPVPDTLVEVWIPESSVEAAAEVLLTMQSDLREPGQLSMPNEHPNAGALSVADTRRCKACGETSPAGFGECWNCQADLI